MEASMKSVLYGLLLLLVPDLATLEAGITRLSTCPASSPLMFEAHARDGCVLLCVIRWRRGDPWQGPEMRLLIDVSRHVIRPLEYAELVVHELAGDREHSIDVALELKLSVQLMQWLVSARQAGHRLDASADIDAEV
jgi:hypothetical protein